MLFLERLAKKSEEKGQDDCVRQKNIEESMNVSYLLSFFKIAN